MKILVCIKQVLDSDETLSINDDSSWIIHNKQSVFRMNRYDEFALEEAIRINENSPGTTTIDAISIGPSRVCSTVRKTLEMGAHDGIHILTPDEAYMSPTQTASLIAGFAEGKGYDLILTGVMAEDDMHCQVGQLTAGFLNLPCATSVIYLSIHDDNVTVYAERELEHGRRSCLELDMPCVLTIQSGINRPRYPSLSNVIRAKSQDITTIDARAFNPSEKQEVIKRIRRPENGPNGRFIEGSTHDKAKELIRILHEQSIL